MPRKNPYARFTYDPRPVDSVVMRMTYEPWGGDYRFTVTIRRHGDTTPQSEHFDGLQIDDVDEMLPVVMSSLSRDPNAFG